MRWIALFLLVAVLWASGLAVGESIRGAMEIGGDVYIIEYDGDTLSISRASTACGLYFFGGSVGCRGHEVELTSETACVVQGYVESKGRSQRWG